MSIIIGIAIVALISLVVAVFGMSIFHTYERFLAMSQRQIPPILLIYNADGLGYLKLAFSLFLSVVQAPNLTQHCSPSVRNPL